ncbi:MAG: hypothetical protein P1U74_08505 [Legionellaceae bacterium]|nr:hypothetical protein [Legionellaceae bacterium]
MPKNTNGKSSKNQVEQDNERMVQEELSRRKTSKGKNKQNISALSGVSPGESEVQRDNGPWTAKAASTRNQEAEIKQHQKENTSRRERVEKSQEQMEKEHGQKWQQLDEKQQQEIEELEKSHIAALDTIKQEHAEVRQEMAAEHSAVRHEIKVEFKANLQEKRQKLKQTKKEAWVSHLNKDETKNIKQQQLKKLQEVTSEHLAEREILKANLLENIKSIEEKQEVIENELINQQQMELLSLRPEPGRSHQESEEEIELKNQHAMQLAELKSEHAQQKSEVRQDYIYRRDEIIEQQEAQIADIKLVNKQQLREAAKSQNQVQKEISSTHQQDLQGLKVGYHSLVQDILSSQAMARVDVKISQQETINALTTKLYRELTTKYKIHEEQRVELRQELSEERQALGYITKNSILDGPKISFQNKEDDDEEDEDQSTRFGI